MAKSVKRKKTEEIATPKSFSKGLTTTEIINKKIRNKNAVITEEDMKNVKIDPLLPHDKAHEPLPIPNTSERPKDEDKDNKVATPWNVISE